MSARQLPPPWSLRQIAYRVAPIPKRPRPSQISPAWSEMCLIIETVRSEGLAGPARLGCYLLCRGEEVLARGFFSGPAGSDTDLTALGQLSRRLRLEAPRTLEQFLKLVYRYAYKKRLPLVGFGLAAQLASVAVDWRETDATGMFEGAIALILWTKPPTDKRDKTRLLRNGRIEDGHRPRVLCKLLADGSIVLAFANRGDPDYVDRIAEADGTARKGQVVRGHFVPLERFGYGLTGARTRSLADACARVGIDCTDKEPVDGGTDLLEAAECCLARAETAHRLYLELLDEHRSLGLTLPPDRVFSPASYAKATCDAIGITPPYGRYDGEVAGIGAAMCAAYGGWSGVGIRSVPDSPPLPVRVIDVASEYPVCAHRLGIWKLLTAERLTLQPVEPAKIKRWISRQRPGTFRLSPELCVFCRLRPDGDVLPHRIRPGATWLTNVAPLWYDDALWWPLPDLVRSYLETGVIPPIEACLTLSGSGRLADLRPIELPGLGRFDPRVEGADLFLFLAEGRQRLERGETNLDDEERNRLAALYKLWDNSLCSGIFLEVHPHEPTKQPQKGTVLGPDGSYETEAHGFEETGRWFFPPFYSLVTSAGRLLLYLAMHEVRAAGGTVAYFDTDSLAILATPEGGLVPVMGGRLTDDQGRECEHALSYAAVDEIRWSLERHSPYRRDTSDMTHSRRPSAAVREPMLFRLEPENFAADQLYFLAIASKRKTPYVITEAGAEPVSPSEFGLGHLLDPSGRGDTRWINDGWQSAALGGPEPDWLETPVLAHVTLTRYADIARLDTGTTASPRPFDTLVVAQADRIYGATSDGGIPRPVALYRADFTVEQAAWRDFATGLPLPHAASPPRDADEPALSRERPLYLRRMRQLFATHVRAPERKALDGNGQPCKGRTEGLLEAAPTVAYRAIPIGRETNYSETAGVLNEPEFTSFPGRGREDVAERALAVLRRAAHTARQSELASALGLSSSGLRRFLTSGRARAHTQTRVTHHAAVLACAALARAYPGQRLPEDPEVLLFLAERYHGLFDPPRCEGCGKQLNGRQKRWCERCRAQPRRRARVTPAKSQRLN
jgi:hypothetical protein